MIRFKCECGRELQGRDEDTGKQAKCPACGKILRIPAGGTDVAEEGPAGRGPAEAVRADRPEGRYADDRPRPRRDERKRPNGPVGTSGKATASLILGITSMCLVIPAIPGLILGVLALRDIGKSDGRLGGNGLALTGIILSCLSFIAIVPIAILIGLLLPAVQNVRTAAARMQEMNNLKQIGLALHNYHDTNKGFPPAARRLPDGKPPVSWRVLLLPYLEQDNLFRMYRMDEPWDGPNNRQLLSSMPKVYETPGVPQPGPGLTYFQVLVGPGTMFEDPTKMKPEPALGLPPPPGQGLRLAHVKDGTPNTILVVLGKDPVPWTKPEDIAFDPNGPPPRLADHFPSGFNVLFVDGSVRPIKKSVSVQTLRGLITRNGGEMLGGDF